MCAEVASTMDLLPTMARLGGGRVPDDRVIDGHDIGDLLAGKPGAQSPTEAFFFYQQTRLCAVLAGKWKLQLPRPVNKQWAVYSTPEDGVAIEKPLLFDLEADIGEKTDVSDAHPDVVKQLLAHAEKARADIGDFDRAGSGARFFDDAPRRPDLNQSQDTKPPARTKRANAKHR